NLRIVDEDEWAAAHNRLAAAAAVYVGSTKGQKWGRPQSTIESPYLFGGLGRCGLCGDASMTARNSSHGRQRYFVCANYDHRGRSVCSNALRLPMERADEAILTKIREYIFDPEV